MAIRPVDLNQTQRRLFGPNFEAQHIDCSAGNLFVLVGGDGPPLLLLHGYPQTSAMWHRVAGALAQHFRLIIPDLRGYGDSSKPTSQTNHASYAKRAMALDVVEIMHALGHDRFFVAGHDRGGRVTHRLALAHSERLAAACIMDIVPTLHVFENTDQALASAYYHWFFLIQPAGLPERLIGNDPDYYLAHKFASGCRSDNSLSCDALDEYRRCFRHPETIRGSCEDYRAAASIDLEHDRADRGRKIDTPLLVLWGDAAFVHRHYDVLQVWSDFTNNVTGHAVPSGHYLPEETPDSVIQALTEFYAGHHL